MMKLPQNPIFIVGYPRSGTTLLQRILAAQPDIYTFPETHYFNVIEKEVRWDREASGEMISRDSLPEILGKIYEKMELNLTESEMSRLQILATNKKLSSKSLFEMIVSHYLYALNPGIQDESSFRWVEKTPFHAQFLERIISMYPAMQALHIIRHPVPAIYSRKKKFPFNRDTSVIQLARRWKKMLMYIEEFKGKYPDHIFTVRYEDLVRNFNNRSQAIAAFLNISIDINTLDLLKQKRGREKFFILTSEKWKLDDLENEIKITNHHYRNLMDSEEIRTIENITMDMMSRYGYEPFERSSDDCL